ncbi:MAG: metalloregulator ArsR/SmtB family transcription factor [Spirochaetia bacterium]|nr:metalloregulator ArsR/SmtB family transcription factor [Spirochaetia bacterium]
MLAVIPQVEAVHVLKAIADESRLRIVAVLGREPLHVNELIEVLGMGQSRVSRHLRILSDARILEGDREGTRVYYRLTSRARESEFLSGIMSTLANPAESREVALPSEILSDQKRLIRMIDARTIKSRQYFETEGADQEELQKDFVDAPYYRRKIVSLLPDPPGLTVDVGCGTGELAVILAEKTERLLCVDRSSTMLERAQERCPAADVRIGAVEHLPLSDGEADTLICSMVLHHMPDPRAALQEAARVIRPGGVLILADLATHEEEIMRSRLADFWLGFDPARLVADLEAAGFRVEDEDRGRGEGRLECLFLKAVRT